MLAHLHVNVLPHTARRRRAIMHFCCKSAHIKLNPFLNNWDYKMRNGHPGFGTEPFTATMSATFLCPARLPLCLRPGRSERPCAPIGIEKASGFRCPIEQFSQRIARKPVSMFQPTFFSATSRTERSSRRCCEMEKDAASSFTEQSESDIRSMNLPAGGIGNRSENETSDWPHKDRLMEYRTCLWNKELYVKHGTAREPATPHAEGSARRSFEQLDSDCLKQKKAPEG
jgi:hypothetical protein